MAMPVPKRMVQSPAYHYSRKQERAAAVRTGGRLTPGSGNMGEAGDVRLKRKLRLECKATERKSFSVTREMLDRIEEAGMPAGEVPVVELEFLPIKGHAGGRYVLCPAWVLDSLMQTLHLEQP